MTLTGSAAAGVEAGEGLSLGLWRLFLATDVPCQVREAASSKELCDDFLAEPGCPDALGAVPHLSARASSVVTDPIGRHAGQSQALLRILQPIYKGKETESLRELWAAVPVPTNLLFANDN